MIFTAVVVLGCAPLEGETETVDGREHALGDEPDEGEAQPETYELAGGDPDWDCTVLCSRLLSCNAQDTKLGAEDGWLFDKGVEGCERSCASASEGEQRSLAALASCDANESCADFYACVQADPS